MSLGKHSLKVRAGLRENHDDNFQTANFNGAFRSERDRPLPRRVLPGPAFSFGNPGVPAVVMGLANGQSVQSLISLRIWASEYFRQRQSCFTRRVPARLGADGIFAGPKIRN